MRFHVANQIWHLRRRFRPSFISSLIPPPRPPLVIRGAPQIGNETEWQDSAGRTISSIPADGPPPRGQNLTTGNGSLSFSSAQYANLSISGNLSVGGSLPLAPNRLVLADSATLHLDSSRATRLAMDPQNLLELAIVNIIRELGLSNELFADIPAVVEQARRVIEQSLRERQQERTLEGRIPVERNPGHEI